MTSAKGAKKSPFNKPCYCRDEQNKLVGECRQPYADLCPSRPGRPEFYSFDNESGGLSIVPMENVGSFAAIGPEMEGQSSALTFLMKDGIQHTMGKLELEEARFLAIHICRFADTGKMVLGRLIDLDNQIAMFRAAKARYAERQKASPIIDPGTGEPMKADAPAIVGVKMEGVGSPAES